MFHSNPFFPPPGGMHRIYLKTPELPPPYVKHPKNARVRRPYLFPIYFTSVISKSRLHLVRCRELAME